MKMYKISEDEKNQVLALINQGMYPSIILKEINRVGNLLAHCPEIPDPTPMPTADNHFEHEGVPAIDKNLDIPRHMHKVSSGFIDEECK
jgi:hypothetical protein